MRWGGLADEKHARVTDAGDSSHAEASRERAAVRSTAAAVLAMAAALYLIDHASDAAVEWTHQTLQLLAAAILCGAGAVRVAHWRRSDDARSGFAGGALILMGLAIPVASIVAVVLSAPEAAVFAALVRGSVLTAAMVLVARNLVTARGTSDTRPDRALRNAAAAAVLSYAVAAGLATWLGVAASTAGEKLPLTVGLLLTLGWCGLAGVSFRHPHHDPHRAVGSLLLGLALAEILIALGTAGEVEFGIAGWALLCAIGGLSARAAVVELQADVSREQRALEETSSALIATRLLIAESDARQAALAHDAQNSLAGLRAVLGTLNIDPLVPTAGNPGLEALRQAAIAELGHLEHMVRRTGAEVTLDFDVDEIIESVCAARRATGMTIRTTPSGLRVNARPGDFATALQNLLVNAATHGGGCPVTVHSHPTPRGVVVLVSDEGPGVPSDIADRVFDRGFRSSASSGSGLGLNISRNIVREQGGDLRLVPTDRGACFAISLPAAAAPRPVVRQPAEPHR